MFVCLCACMSHLYVCMFVCLYVTFVCYVCECMYACVCVSVDILIRNTPFNRNFRKQGRVSYKGNFWSMKNYYKVRCLKTFFWPKVKGKVPHTVRSAFKGISDL